MANKLFRPWVSDPGLGAAEREQMQAPAVFASLVIDRLFDGFSVMVMLAGVLLTLQLPPGMEQSAAVLRAGGVTTLIFYSVVIALLVLLKVRPVATLALLGKLLKPFPAAVAEKCIPLAGSFLGGLHVSRRSADLFAVLLSSLLIWLSATLPIYLVLVGFGIHLPLTASFFIMVLLVFAVMVPAAPGYIGTYHLACYTGLAAFGLPDTESVSVALVIHGVGFFPVILAGLYHVWSQGSHWPACENRPVPDGAAPSDRKSCPLFWTAGHCWPFLFRWDSISGVWHEASPFMTVAEFVTAVQFLGSATSPGYPPFLLLCQALFTGAVRPKQRFSRLIWQQRFRQLWPVLGSIICSGRCWQETDFL